MVQPGSAAVDGAPTSPGGGAVVARPRALPRVQALLDADRERHAAARSTSWWEGVLELVRGLLGPPVLRHAVAALRRGNLEAAFALLQEEVKARPGRPESALLFWNAALSCGRARDAADAMVRLVRTEAGEEAGLEQAANHWTALVNAVPEAVVEVASLAKLVPLLRARSERARGETQAAAQALLVEALRRCVDPAHGALNPALALRIVEEARGIDMEVARSAAQAALGSASLHEAKRSRLEELLAALERGEWPEGQALPAPARPAAAPRAPARPSAPPAAPRTGRKPAAARPQPKSAPARPVAVPRAPRKRAATAPAPPEPSAATPSGRRTVALTQDEIEAASSRLAERMAGRPAAAPPQAGPAPTPAHGAAAPVALPPLLDASDALPVDEPPEKDEPIAILEQEDAVAILEADDADAILEVDAESAMLEPDRREASEADEPDAVLETSDAGVDFEFGGAAASAVPAAEFEIGTALEEDEPVADFEIGTALEDEAGDDFEFGSATVVDAIPEPDAVGEAEAEAEPNILSDAVSDAAGAVASPAPALRAIDILPVELGSDGLVAFEVAHAQRSRIDYRAIEAIAAAEVTGLADEPILVVELVLRARPGRSRSALRMRCDTFDAASLFPDRTDAGQALRAMLADLLERTRALPLPDPDSALAIRPQRFESLAAFESALLARLPA